MDQTKQIINDAHILSYQESEDDENSYSNDENDDLNDGIGRDGRGAKGCMEEDVIDKTIILMPQKAPGKKRHELNSFIKSLSKGVSAEKAIALISVQNKPTLANSLMLIQDTLTGNTGDKKLHTTESRTKFLRDNSETIENCVKLERLSTAHKSTIIGNYDERMDLINMHPKIPM